MINVVTPERNKKERAVRVMTTRRQLSFTAKLEEKTRRISQCEIDLSPDAIREAPRVEIDSRTIMYLLDEEAKKPPWAALEGANLEVQRLYAQWETLQLQDAVLYRNFLGTDGQLRWR